MQPGPQPYGPPAQPKAKTPVWIIVLIVVLGGGLVLVGVLASLAIYGTRRYLASAKTAEAKNTIGAIARGARQSYERETVDASGNPRHALCKSANPVPSMVPSGVKYMPGAGDFDTGDAETGWKCLKFSITQSIYYQYSYNQGTGYLATAVNPGPTGFEAAARGDLDGDGMTSLFAITGTESAGDIRVSTMVYIQDEFE
jgi:type IV pilus assembly protein PilA